MMCRTDGLVFGVLTLTKGIGCMQYSWKSGGVETEGLLLSINQTKVTMFKENIRVLAAWNNHRG